MHTSIVTTRKESAVSVCILTKMTYIKVYYGTPLVSNGIMSVPSNTTYILPQLLSHLVSEIISGVWPRVGLAASTWEGRQSLKGVMKLESTFFRFPDSVQEHSERI